MFLVVSSYAFCIKRVRLVVFPTVFCVKRVRLVFFAVGFGIKKCPEVVFRTCERVLQMFYAVGAQVYAVFRAGGNEICQLFSGWQMLRA